MNRPHLKFGVYTSIESSIEFTNQQTAVHYARAVLKFHILHMCIIFLFVMTNEF